LGYLPGFYSFFRHLVNNEIADVSDFLKLHNLDGINSKARRFIRYDFAYSLFFNTHYNIFNKLFAYFYYFVFLIMFISLAWQNIKNIINKNGYLKALARKEIPLLGYILLFCFIYCISAFIAVPPYDRYETRPSGYFVFYRYFCHLLPFVFIVIALGINELWIRNKKFISLSICFILVAISIYSNISILSFKINADIFAKDGFSYYEYGWRLGRHFSGKEDFKKIVIQDRKYRDEFYRGLNEGRVLNKQ
jgi:hypothetical protein